MLFIPHLLFAPWSAGRAFVPTTTPLIMLAVPDDIAARDEAATCTADERAAMAAIGGSGAGTYGEITSRGFARLAERLRLRPDDVFVDCGSGLGMVVEQAARDYSVRRSYGVEYAGSRHAAALARLAERGASGDGSGAIDTSIRLIEGDCAEESQWASGGELSSCSCVYMCNVLFDDALNARLKRCVESCSAVRCVAAFRPWPSGLDGFGEPSMVQCETSWSSETAPRRVLGLELDAYGTSPVYVYERRAALLPSWWSGEIEGLLIVISLAFASSLLGLEP
jgi:hypothetical protein